MITSVSDFIDRIGGQAVIRQKVGVTQQAIWQARKLNRLPVRWTVTLAEEIRRKRIKIDPTLLGMKPQ